MSGANDSKTLASKCLSDTSPTRNSSRQPQDADTDGVLPPGDDGSSEFVQRPGKRDDVSRYARPVSARGVPLPPPIEASIHAIDRLLTEQELAPQRLYSCGIASDVVSEGESRPPHRARARGAGARGESAAMWRAPRILELRVRRPCEQARNQRSKFLVRQRCELQQAGVQALQLAFGHRVEVDTTNALLDPRALQPTSRSRLGQGPQVRRSLAIGD
jgi:hypothetical protein